MRHQHAVKREARKEVQHKHCPDCGTCLIAGITQQNHRCLTSIRPDIAEVMRLDMGGTEDQSRHANRTAFYRELQQYGVFINRGVSGLL